MEQNKVTIIIENNLRRETYTMENAQDIEMSQAPVISHDYLDGENPSSLSTSRPTPSTSQSSFVLSMIRRQPAL